MKRSKSSTIENYLLSLAVHCLLLMILTFFTLKQSDVFNELVIDWLTEEPREITSDDFARAGSPAQSDNRTSESSNRQSIVPINESPLVQEQSPQASIRRSIEPPTTREIGDIDTAPRAGVSSDYLSGIRDRITSTRSGRSGYDFSDSDGDISILKVVLPNPKINDYGEVRLQFKINKNGSVQSGTVLPLAFDDPLYLNESIKALEQWRFSVRRYVSNKIYRITFRFNPE